MKVITFSRFFPKGHPKAGEPTFFVEKILRNYWVEPNWCNIEVSDFVKRYTSQMGLIANPNHFAAKIHTIRSGNRFQVGEWFSPRVWTGKPYSSKQIQFAPSIMVEKVIPFETYGLTTLINGVPANNLTLAQVALNDGLSFEDFKSWFSIHPKMKKEGFVGQIICWSNKIEY